MTLRLYDTTLRDGTQREGLSLSVEDKIKIARALDRLGVSYIEGGWPGSNPKDAEFFRRIREVALEHARIAAFGSTRRARVRCEDDANLACAAGSTVQGCASISCSSPAARRAGWPKARASRKPRAPTSSTSIWAARPST